MTGWTLPFLGVPWRDKGRDRYGADCGGLVHLVYGQRLGIEIPDESYISAEERGERAGAINRRAKAWPWIGVPHGQEKPFDVVIFSRGGLDDHIGIVVEPGSMLHVVNGGRSAVDDYGRPPWQRISGFYRHEALA